MSNHIWVYHGATCEEVHQANEAEWVDVELGGLATPHMSFVSLSFDRDHVDKLARDLWDTIQGQYEESFGCGLPFPNLQTRRTTDYYDVAETAETAKTGIRRTQTTDYFIGHMIEPIIRVVAEERELR